MSSSSSAPAPASSPRAFWRARLTSAFLAEVLPPTGEAFASNRVYRDCLRGVFDMRPEARTAFGDGALVTRPDTTTGAAGLDAETADELAFDGEATRAGLADWYALTEDDPDFLTLYDRVGYTFVQLNPEVGAAALMNFDDFAPYCRSIAAFLAGGRPAPELFALLNKFRPREG